jgi:hypothetical protein
VIPPTRDGRPFRRVETLSFGKGDKWRPLRLVLDGATLAAEEVELLVSFAQEEELELWRTAPNVLPRLEIGEPFDTFPAMGGALSIHDFAPNRNAGVFGVYGTERLRRQAADIAGAEGEASIGPVPPRLAKYKSTTSNMWRCCRLLGKNFLSY